jgi:phospho-N-acetylmuramoyl-pentapeptide-transferase
VDGPEAHHAKAGTATMGGVLFLAGASVVGIVLGLSGHRDALAALLAMLAFGALGAFDDLQGLRDVQGVGWLARSKFVWQWGLGLAVAVALKLLVGDLPTLVPLVGTRLDLGWWMVPITCVLLVGFSNAINLTDGLDGLAGCTSAIAFGAYGWLALAASQSGLALYVLALVGALLAFLWWNVHPARLFMGDTGSEALGAGLAAVAVLSGYWLVLPVIGLLFVAESLSVMAQVAYFKYTRHKYGEGRRILRMAPLHHHLELSGWSESQIVSRFCLIAVALAAIGIAVGVS